MTDICTHIAWVVFPLLSIGDTHGYGENLYFHTLRLFCILKRYREYETVRCSHLSNFRLIGHTCYKEMFTKYNSTKHILLQLKPFLLPVCHINSNHRVYRSIFRVGMIGCVVCGKWSCPTSQKLERTAITTTWPSQYLKS